NIIPSLLKHMQDILNSLTMSVCQHAADIFRQEKFRCKLFQEPDIIIKQFSSGIFDSSQCACFRPRLARRSANDTVHLSINIRSNSFFGDLPDIAFDQMGLWMIDLKCLINGLIKLVCYWNMKSSPLKSQIKTAASGK